MTDRDAERERAVRWAEEVAREYQDFILTGGESVPSMPMVVIP